MDMSYPLSQELKPLFSHPIFTSSKVGIHIVNLRTKEEVFGYHPDDVLVPASVMKAITSATALRILGADFSFETNFYIDGEIKREVLHGDLYVKGGGDPSLEVHHLWKIAHDLKNKGIGRITGNIYYDNTIFGGDHLIPGWDKSVDIANGPSYFPKISGLSLNYNCVALHVFAGEKVSDSARAFIEYPSSDITIVNNLKTVKAYARPRVSLSRSVEGKSLQFTVEGQVPMGEDWTYYRTVHSPEDYFMSQFAEVLKHNQILVNGEHTLRTVPENLTIFHSFKSASLGTLIKTMNKYSQNLFAENIFRMLGVHTGKPSTDVVLEYLASLGIQTDRIAIQNGSGLSKETVLAPSDISLVFADMYASKYVGSEYMTSLAVAGFDGTLRKRLNDEDMMGKFRGKTGSLNFVFCVGGLVFGYDGDMYSFVFLINDLNISAVQARSLQDSFLEKLIRVPNVNK